MTQQILGRVIDLCLGHRILGGLLGTLLGPGGTDSLQGAGRFTIRRALPWSHLGKLLRGLDGGRRGLNAGRAAQGVEFPCQYADFPGLLIQSLALLGNFALLLLQQGDNLRHIHGCRGSYCGGSSGLRRCHYIAGANGDGQCSRVPSSSGHFLAPRRNNHK